MNIRLCFPDPAVKGFYFPSAESVLKAFHANGMLHLFKHSVRTAADTHGRGIGRHKLGELTLYRLELPHHHIIFIIVYLRRVLDVIFSAVVIKLLTKLFGTLPAAFNIGHF